MFTRNATARWKGSLKEGSGQIEVGSGAFSGPYSYNTRFENRQGTNPEELIGAAHAGCYSMALSAALTKAGFEPKKIHTTAKVQLSEDKDDGGFAIDLVHLSTKAEVPEIDEGRFKQIVSQAKESCPVSKALASTNITLESTLQS